MDRSWVRKGFGAMACALVLGAGSAAQAADKSPAGDVIASAGPATVTTAEMQKILRTLDPQTRAQFLSNPTQVRDEVRQRLAENLLLRDAKARKIEEQPAVIAAIERAKNKILVEAYMQSAVPLSAIPEPSDAELRQLYEKNKENPRLMAPKTFRLAQILVAVPQGADQATDEKAHQKAVDLAKQAKAKPADFAALAKANSDDATSAQKGGEVEPLAEDQLAQPVRQLVSSMNRGDVTADPIRTPGGWSILKMLDIKPPALRSYDEVKPGLIQVVKQAQLEQAQQKYVVDFVQKNNPQVPDAAITKFIADSQNLK